MATASAAAIFTFEDDARFSFAPSIPELGPQIDREAGIMRGVKIVGLKSNNLGKTIGVEGPGADLPYEYDRLGMRSALAAYEGQSIFMNHLPFKYDEKGRRIPVVFERSNDDLIGWFENVRFIDDPNPDVAGVYGDWHVVMSHPMANRCFEIAERNPRALGMSHEAFIQDPVMRDGKLIIPGIVRVDAIALVSARPGTTRGLFESQSKESPKMKTTFRKIFEAFAAAPATKDHKGVKRVLEMMGEGAIGATIADQSIDEPTTPNADAMAKDAFLAMIVAAVQDDSLDMAATLERVKQILQAQEDLLTGGTSKPADPPADPPPADPPPADPKANESLAPSGTIVLECVGLLNEFKVNAAPAILSAMARIPKPEDRKAYAMELGRFAATPATAPVSAPPPRSAAPPPPKSEDPPAASAGLTPEQFLQKIRGG